MLTDTASPTGSEDPVRDLANSSVDESRSRDVIGHLYEAQLSKDRGSSRQQELKRDTELKQLALLLMELEVRALSSLEAQELSTTTGKVIRTLTISPQTKEVSEVQLGERPVLVLFTEEQTVREAYTLLYSLLESTKPVPKPRVRSSLGSGRQSSLVEALKRGMETGRG